MAEAMNSECIWEKIQRAVQRAESREQYREQRAESGQVAPGRRIS